MADEVDIANDLQELALQQALNAARVGGPRLVARGACYNCDEILAPRADGQHVQLFCDGDCADDWERMQAAKARNGRA